VSVIDTIELVIRGEGGSGGSGSAVGWLELLLGGLLLGLRRLGLRVPRLRFTSRSVAGFGSLVLAAALGATSPAAHAEGWYLTAGIGQASADYGAGDLTADLAARGWTIRDVSVDDTDAAWRVGVGFELTDRLAVEGGFVDLGDVDTLYRASVRPTEVDALLQDTLDVHGYLGRGWTLGGVGRLPIGNGTVAVVGRGGFFFWEADLDVEVIQGGTGRVDGNEDGIGGYYGVGLEFRVQPQVRFTLDWDRYKLDDWVDVPTLGLRLSF
jgi:hypothetical protein